MTESRADALPLPFGRTFYYGWITPAVAALAMVGTIGIGRLVDRFGSRLLFAIVSLALGLVVLGMSAFD